MADKKQELHDLMKKYVNNSSNTIDITKFRTEHPSDYALLPHYFGSVQKAIEEGGWVKVVKAAHKAGTGVTLRNALAFDMLELLRKGGSISRSTLEEIAEKYGVTRPAINQLHKALKTTTEESASTEQ